MIENLATAFLNRQYMISRDFEIYYYKDLNFHNVEKHSHSPDEERRHVNHPARDAALC